MDSDVDLGGRSIEVSHSLGTREAPVHKAGRCFGRVAPGVLGLPWTIHQICSAPTFRTRLLALGQECKTKQKAAKTTVPGILVALYRKTDFGRARLEGEGKMGDLFVAVG